MNHIILHRHKGNPWKFEWVEEKQHYLHTTRYGTKYKIRFDELEGVLLFRWITKPYRLASWFEWSEEIRADYFDLGRVRITFKGRG